MNIYISVEVKNRELFSRMLLAFEAAKRGHDVYVGELTPFFDRNIFRPGIYHVNSVTPRKNKVNTFKNLIQNSFFITSQDEESGHSNDNTEHYTNTRYGKSSLQYVEKIFTWGLLDYKRLVKKYCKFKNKFINTGNPRIDFLKKKNQKFFSKKIINFKDYILVSSNFENICGHLNLSERIYWLRKLDYFKRGYISIEKLIERNVEEAKIFNDFVKFIKEVSINLPKKKIIFRPHPTENPNDWKEIFYDFKNIEVNNYGNIGNWITNSSLILHNGCTGGLEAALRNKHVVAFSPNGLNIGHKLPNDLSISFKDINSAIKYIKKNVNQKKFIFLKKKYKKLIQNNFENYYGKNAHESIVDEWDKISINKKYNQNNIFKIKFLTFLLKIKLKMINYKNQSKKFSNFTKIEVNEMYNNFCLLNRGYKNIKIELISGKLLRICKSDT